VDRSTIDHLLSRWINGNIAVASSSAALLYLVLAYAAQVRSESAEDTYRSQSFFYHGRRIALMELTEYPTMETTQAFTLISLYMLGSCRRNGAYLNLGIAISAAKSLGYHRSEVALPQCGDDEWLKYEDVFICKTFDMCSVVNNPMTI
jgi:hypothetical protein